MESPPTPRTTTSKTKPNMSTRTAIPKNFARGKSKSLALIQKKVPLLAAPVTPGAKLQTKESRSTSKRRRPSRSRSKSSSSDDHSEIKIEVQNVTPTLNNLNDSHSELFLCDKCPYTTELLGTFKRHCASHQTAETPKKKKQNLNIVSAKFVDSTDSEGNNELRYEKRPAVVKCDKCNYTANKAFRVRRHYKVHMEQSDRKGILPCPYDGCNWMATFYEPLEQHLTEQHGLEIDSETLYFQNHADFLVWVLRLKETDSARYVCRTSGKNTNKVNLYNCNRTCLLKTKSNWTGKRRRRQAGSIKSDKLCVSRIRVEYENVEERTGLTVKYCKTHTGHEVDPLRLGRALIPRKPRKVDLLLQRIESGYTEPEPEPVRSMEDVLADADQYYNDAREFVKDSASANSFLLLLQGVFDNMKRQNAESDSQAEIEAEIAHTDTEVLPAEETEEMITIPLEEPTYTKRQRRRRATCKKINEDPLSDENMSTSELFNRIIWS